MTTSPTKRFFGALLMAVGGLIAGLCGLCTGGFIVVFLVLAFRGNSDFDSPMGAILFPLMQGGVPILIGLGLFFIGRRLYRS